MGNIAVVSSFLKIKDGAYCFTVGCHKGSQFLLFLLQ